MSDKKFKRKNNAIQLPWNVPVFEEKWVEWLQYRRERHLAAYTATGLKRTFEGLVRDAGNDMETAIAIIDQSIEKSWQGLFPLKKPLKNESKQQITAGGLSEAIAKRYAG